MPQTHGMEDPYAHLPEWARDIERGYQTWVASGSRTVMPPSLEDKVQLPQLYSSPDAQAWMHAGWQAGWFTLWQRVRVELGFDIRQAGSDGEEAGRGPQRAA